MGTHIRSLKLDLSTTTSLTTTKQFEALVVIDRVKK